MDPIDYTSAFKGLESPTQSFTQGLQAGVVTADVLAAQQQKQAALAQKQQMNADLALLSQNPTPEAIGKLSIKYPQLSEQLKRSADVLAPSAQQAQLDHATQVYAAINNNEPGVAQDLLKERATALRNSGDERGAAAADTMATLIKDHPEFAKTTIGLRLASSLGADKFTAAFTGIGGEQRAAAEAPVDLRTKTAGAAKAEADARTAGANATVAQATIPEQIAKPASDLATAEQKRRLDQFDAEIRSADSQTRRGELTLAREKYVAEQGLKQQDIGASSQAQIDSAQMALDNIKSLRNNPILKDTTGNSWAGIGTVLGQMLGNVPGTENKDFRGQLESLKSQIFLPAVQQVKGMGALSNAEGEKLTASVAALDANMSPAAFKNALGVVERYMTKGLQKGLAAKNVPTQGGGFVANHPTFGTIKEGDINRLMKQYPGATREQIITYLSQTGAK